MNQARVAAVQVLERFETLWGAPLEELFLTSEVLADQLYHFTWTQWHDGFKVVGAQVSIQVHAAGRVAALGSTAEQLPASFDSQARVGPERACTIAWRGRAFAPGDQSLVSLPLIHVSYTEGRSLARLAYLVDVLQHSTQRYERVYVDAVDAAVLAVEAGAVHASDVHGSVSGKANTGVGALNTPQYTSLELVTVDIPGAGTVDSDSFGDYFFSTPLPGPFLVDASLAGPTYNVNNAQGSDLTPLKFTTFQSGVQETLIQFNDSPTEFDTAQVTGAWLHNQSRIYAQDHVDGFTPALDQEVRVNMDTLLSGPCNGDYVPATKALRFTRSSTSGVTCTNMVFSSFFEHEYGHFVDDAIGGLSAPSLTEALADTFCMFATGQPLIGKDWKGLGTFGRTGNNSKVWPIVHTDPHLIGEPFMGFAWQAREALVAALGPIAGVQVAEVDFLGVLSANTRQIPVAVTQVFLNDDDDGNLSNGTPHYPLLAEVALDRGLTPPDVDVITLAHDAHPDTWNQSQPLDIIVGVAVQPGSTLAAVELEYAIGDGGALVAVTMSEGTTSGSWLGQIPETVGPTVLRYRITARDQDGYAESLPSRDGFFVFAVGARTDVYLQDFESGSAGWTHGGNLDDWELGAPTPSGVNFFDPQAAFSGTSCWGNDLQLGSTDGLYEIGANNFLRSPSMSGTGSTGLRLRYGRWLSVQDFPDSASIVINGVTKYQNPVDDLFDRDWFVHDLDASSADGVGSFQIEWRLSGGPGASKPGGWNVDHVEVYALNSTPVLNLDITPSTFTPGIGTTVQFNMMGTPNASWNLFMSTTSGPTTLDGYGVLSVGSDSASIGTGTLDSSGNGSVSYLVPNLPQLIGQDFFFIGVATQTGALGQISNPVRLEIQ